MNSATSVQPTTTSNAAFMMSSTQALDDIVRAISTMPTADVKRLQRAIREHLGLDRAVAGDNADVVSVRLPAATLRAMNFLATVRRVSLSAVLREAIKSYRPRELRW
jgi:hypothetical protein